MSSHFTSRQNGACGRYPAYHWTALAVILATLWLVPPAVAQTKPLTAQATDSVLATTRIIDLENGARAIRACPTGLKTLTPEQDSIARRAEMFYFDQFRHSQDPEAPTFLFMSKSADMLMGIGGVVRMRGWYEWGGAVPTPAFMPSMIPIPADRASMRRFGTTPSGTALYFVVLGNSRLGEYKLYIEANFNGYQSRDFLLKKAYATLGDVTVGYAASTFSDPAALPPTVDASGATNKIGKTDVLVRWMRTFHPGITVAVSAENPSASIDCGAASQTARSTQWLPDGAAFVQYQWGHGGMEHVRLSGIVRGLPYRDLAASCNRTVAGWGLQLSSVAHPVPQVTTYATVSYGHGYAGLSNDFATGNYDLVADPAAPGRLYTPAAYGYNLGVQYNFTPALFVSASFSQNRYLPSHTVSPDEYRRGWMAAANCFWNILPRLQVGAEFMIGRRVNADHAARMARRIGAMCQYSF